jgi:hypothetical protein
MVQNLNNHLSTTSKDFEEKYINPSCRSFRIGFRNSNGYSIIGESARISKSPLLNPCNEIIQYSENVLVYMQQFITMKRLALAPYKIYCL